MLSLKASHYAVCKKALMPIKSWGVCVNLSWKTSRNTILMIFSFEKARKNKLFMILFAVIK